MTDDLARRCARAMQLLTPEGETLAAGRASVCVLGVLGYPRVARVAGLAPFIWGVELGYWIVARNRSFLSQLLPKE